MSKKDRERRWEFQDLGVREHDVQKFKDPRFWHPTEGLGDWRAFVDESLHEVWDDLPDKIKAAVYKMARKIYQLEDERNDYTTPLE